MKKNKIISLVLAFCLTFTLCVPMLSPIMSFAYEEVIFINDANDFLKFVKNCSYDAWSIGKTVILKNDISLLGIDFQPIPSFSGTFDGNGKSITDVTLEGKYSPAGIFATVEKDGVVKNLTVRGSICPGGDKAIVGGIVGENYGTIEGCSFVGSIIGKSEVGGIAGINRLSGSIISCTTSADIIGEQKTGGIAGNNSGLISRCESKSKVNTLSITPQISLSDISISLSLDISKLTSINTQTTTDFGGIAGYSTGIIMGCTNNGPVGYPHIGYNAGGIAGRSSGHLSGNINNAQINGRKDVGGIVGQIEPYISYNLSEDLLTALKAELDQLEVLINSALNSTDGGLTTVSTRFNNILSDLADATVSIETLLGNASDYGDDVIGEINRVSDILSEVLNQLSNISKDIPEITDLLGDTLADIENMLIGLEKVTSIGSDAITDFIYMVEDTATAFDTISQGMDKIESAMSAFENAIKINDKDAAQAALNAIADGLSEMIRSTDSVVTAVDSIVTIFGEAGWIDDSINQFGKMATVVKSMSSAITDIYDATTEISNNIDIYWDNIKGAENELIIAFDHFTKAIINMEKSLGIFEEGFEDITEGLYLLYESIENIDTEKIPEAIGSITDGFEKLASATQSSIDALTDLSEALEEADSSLSIESLRKITSALSDLSDSSQEANDAMNDISEGITNLLTYVDINYETASEGATLIIGGLSITTEAMKELKNAFSSFSSGMIALNNAINLIKESVSVKDEDAIKSALTKAYESLGKIINSVDDMADIMIDLTDTMKDAKVWGDKLIGSVKELTEALSLVSGALVKVQDGIDSLRNNISIDGDLVSSGVSLIRQGVGDISVACGQIKDALLHLADALKIIDQASAEMPAVFEHLTQAVSKLSMCMDKFTTISENVSSLISYMSNVETVQFPTPPESMKTTAGELFASISSIESELMYLNADLTGLGVTLIDTISRINSLFNDMSDNIVDMIYGISDGSIVDNNVTEEEIDSVTNGKIFSCENYGKVNGDINVGGIGGAIGLEYTLDPEDDLSLELNVTQKKQYKLKAVIHASKNYGEITSKYDCAGGICGKMDLGLIYGCESYSKVESQSGNYVGGIAGTTAGLVSQCFVKAVLFGGKYVGGIVGSGVNEDLEGDSSMVRNNYSMVEILRYSQYAGAISGANIGQFSENLFISEDLAGIDITSYKGKAEPITYEEFIRRRSIPTGFYSFTLKFVADGVVILAKEFEYGQSFDSSIIPEIPSKNGQYGYWDNTNLQNLVFDTTINAVYKPYVTALGSENIRENGREVFFVRGEFTHNDKLSISSTADTSALALANNLFTVDTLVEVWTIKIPADTLESNTLHFLPDSDYIKLLIKENGIWKELETKTFGSYLTFEANGDKIELAVVKQTVKPMPVIIISLILIIQIGLIIAFVILNKKKKALLANGSEEAKAEVNDEIEIQAEEKGDEKSTDSTNQKKKKKKSKK